MLAAVESGIDRFEGSVGGLGGCPYAPSASGNVATEDALHMFEALGYDTGVDLARVLAVARGLADVVGHAGHGHVCKAGLTAPWSLCFTASQHLRVPKAAFRPKRPSSSRNRPTGKPPRYVASSSRTQRSRQQHRMPKSSPYGSAPVHCRIPSRKSVLI
ncbi:hypothetical protein [Ramlibacter tataouinensis]|uniref:hypothetical protein n=1 Tax=Ramlibacter tataouinensis TaxID=94132 RepID=UPI0034DF6033